MEKYQKRVVKELFKLEKKATALQAFINSDDYQEKIGSEGDELLVSQLHSMWVYASILKRRIQNFIVPATASEPVSRTTPEDDDLFKNIGIVEIKGGDVKAALDEVFDIVKNKIKEDADGKSTQKD